jgi:hypothetical protein
MSTEYDVMYVSVPIPSCKALGLPTGSRGWIVELTEDGERRVAAGPFETESAAIDALYALKLSRRRLA